MQAIVTKYLGPTNSRGARVKAFCDAGGITVPWDYALDTEGNHDRAARALIQKLGWNEDWREPWHRGGLPAKAPYVNVYVCAGKKLDTKLP